jgi:hypothetical protein
MNKIVQHDLWEKIQKFGLDDPSSVIPFSKKLQTENNWTVAFTTLAIDEYRKFIFLCCILPEGASPSPVIDIVWHLHLTYTKNYWIEFCSKTLQKDIHHVPSGGGVTEKEKYTKWYAQTLIRYKEVFGINPPRNIWPNAPQLIEPPRIDVYEKKYFNKIALAFISGVIVFTIGTGMFAADGEDFLFYYGILLIAAFLTSWVLQRHKSVRLQHFIEEHFPAKFSPYQVGNFLYGKHRAYQTAIVDLLKRDIVQLEGQEFTIKETPLPASAGDNPLLPSLTQTLVVGQTFNYREGLILSDPEKLNHPFFDSLKLLSKNLDRKKFLIPAVVLLIGFARLIQGMAGHYPVNFLIGELGLYVLVTTMMAANYSYAGLVYRHVAQTWKQHPGGSPEDFVNKLTLSGIAAITGFAEFPVLSAMFLAEAPVENGNRDNSAAGSYSWGSGGDGDGGSCGGGGCGGCGGGD